MYFRELVVRFRTEKSIGSYRNLSPIIYRLFARSVYQLLCLQKQLQCPECSFTNCLYRSLFENNPSHSKIVPPFSINHEKTDLEGFSVRFIFFEPVIDQISTLMLAILRLHNCFITEQEERISIRIESIYSGRQEAVYIENQDTLFIPEKEVMRWQPTTSAAVHLHFISPLKLQYGTHLVREFQWGTLVRNLYNRVATYHQIQAPPVWDLPPIHTISARRAQHQMQWVRSGSYTNRQGKRVFLEGLIGTVYLEQASPETIALLRLGEKIQVGEETSLGLGRYQMDII